MELRLLHLQSTNISAFSFCKSNPFSPIILTILRQLSFALSNNSYSVLYVLRYWLPLEQIFEWDLDWMAFLSFSIRRLCLCDPHNSTQICTLLYQIYLNHVCACHHLSIIWYIFRQLETNLYPSILSQTHLRYQHRFFSLNMWENHLLKICKTVAPQIDLIKKGVCCVERAPTLSACLAI